MTSISATNWTVDFQDEGMPGNVNKIQGIIDNNASSGDTLIFNGVSYSHVYLEINKPLNIVSNVNTKILSCPSNPDNPIFTINSGGIGTNISGFQLISSGTNSVAIYINNSKNVKIENNQISSSGYGIKIENGDGAVIKNNSIKNSNIGLNLFSSSSVKILENTITNNQEGIIFDGNTSYCEISKNNISQNQGNGIALLGSESTFHQNIKITYNYINDNQDKSGIFINCSFPNMNISSNMIVNNGQHGIFMGVGSNKTDNSMIIEYNYIMDNKGYKNYEIQRIDTNDEERLLLTIGYNFYGGTSRNLASLCSITLTGIIVPELTKVSNGIYRISYLRENERTLIKEMIPHYLKIYFNDQYITIFVSGGTALIDLREYNFKSTGNQVSIYYKFPIYLLIKDNEIPIKSLDISTSTNQNKVKNGELVQYTTTVKNNGDKIVQNIQIRELIPNFDVYSFTVSKGSFDKKTMIWTIPLMNYGEIAILTISFKSNKATTYKISPILNGDGFNLKSNEISLKVEDYVSISSSNKIQSSKIKKNKATYLISIIKNSGTKSSNYIAVKIQLPKGLKILSQNYKSNFNKKTNVWKIKIPTKKIIQLKMKVKGTKKAKFKIVFNVNGKKQVKYLKIY